MLSKLFGIHAQLRQLTVCQIDYGEHVAVGPHVLADLYLKIQCFCMEDELVFALLLPLLRKVELSLRSPVGMEGILADESKISLVLHAFLQDYVVFYGRLLLADPPRIN